MGEDATRTAASGTSSSLAFGAYRLLQKLSNTYKDYVAYKLLTEERARREAAKASIKTGIR